MKSIEVIQPAVFGDDIKAFFTLKNESYHSGVKITGFNLGYNTDEKESVIKENRKQLYNLLEEGDEIAYANQIHSNNVARVSAGGIVDGCDALITQETGLALAIQVADCAAVLIYEPKSKMIAAVHAGWRGAASGIVLKVLNEMKEKGAKLSSARAYTSPCICMEHFEVGPEVAEQFPDSFVDYKSFSKPHINLKRFIAHQLTAKGLNEANVEVSDGCTIENEEQFYSYRREKGNSGRMVAVIKMRSKIS